MLGEMHPASVYEDCETKINGKVVYVGQQPWLIHDSIRNNIILGRPFNPDLYQKSLSYSCLD